MSGLLGPVTANRNMLAQALRPNRREFQMKENTPQGLLDAAAMATSPVPIAGDAVGLLADGYRFATDPGSRTPMNFGLAALGAIPFLPPLLSAGLGKFAQSQGKQLAQLPAGPARNQAGAIVYHGSPHKFDAFDSSKIGTGEGAQAYGHGLYFAENPAVAGEYKSALSPTKVVKTDAGYVAMALDNQAKPIGRKVFDNAADADRWLSQTFPQSKGSLYKVDLPDEAIAKMLDYDKPLSQQSKEVVDAVMKSGFDPNGADIKDLHNWLKAGGDRAISAKGVPGISYLDQGSRATHNSPRINQTRNYVVFPGNEGLLKILERQ